MGDDSSESDVDANLLAEEQRIREQYGLANPTASNEEGIDDEDGAGRRDSFDSDGAAEDGGDDVASSAIADQIRRLESESERLQEERDLLKEQVGNFEDLFQAMAPVDGEDPSKFMETIMVDGVERTQDYRDVKIRDLAKRAKALNVKLNALRESNDGKIKELAAAQFKIDNIGQKEARRAQKASEASAAGEGSPRQQKLRKMRASVSDANRRVEMLNLRGEACERRIGTCADILRSELGLAPDAEINPDAILAKGGEAARQRKKTAEELSLAQTEVKRLRDKVARARKELTNPNFKSRASLLDVDRQAEQDLELMNQQRQEALRELRRDNEFLSEEIQSHEEKISTCKRRVQGLSQERHKHLHQLKRVQEKTELDAKLVAAFEAESTRLRKKLRNGLRDVKADHASQRKDTEESMNNATMVLQSELQRKEDEVFEVQQRLRAIADETQQLRQQAQQVATQTTARGEVRMIRQLKAANSELWDIIQDYERKFTLTEEAIENNEAQLRKENRRRADLQRQLDLSIDDKGRTVTVRVHEEETLAQQLEALRHEEHVIKQKYREREKEVDQELTLYQSMCDEIRGQLQSSGSRRGGGGRGQEHDSHGTGDAREVSGILEENSRLRDEIQQRQRQLQR